MALPNPFVRRRRTRPTPTLEQQRDDMPKIGLFAEPVRVADLQVLAPEVLDDGRHRVTFLVEVRDAEGRRCPDLAVEARVSGPERTRTVQGATDLFGRIRFRMAGPAGTYALEVTDVAAHGLDWARDAGTATAEVTVG
ncbi:MAG: hypothetical protein WEB09_04665 [Nitriliruptor sp.]